MFFTILTLVLAIISGIIGYFIFHDKLKNMDKNNSKFKFYKLYENIFYSISGLFFVLMVLSNFFLVVPNNTYAQFNKRIFGSELKNGKIIATNGEMGPQAFIKREGIYLIPFVNFLYTIQFHKIIEVPEGKILTLVAKDGKPLNNNEYFASDWYDNATPADKKKYSREEYEKNMLDAKFFLEHNGKKGPQVNVLKPGKYPINTYLWKFKLRNATKIPAGFVGVVISKVGQPYKNIERTTNNSDITVPLVPKGYIGVWKDTLTTGDYYLNPNAYKVDLFDIRAQTWLYKGGYAPRETQLYVNSDGEIAYKTIQHQRLPIPKNAADGAIAVKTKDKYTVYIEARLQVQPDPQHASAIVAGIGNLQNVEDKIITPAVRSIARNVGMNYNAVEFIEKRVEIERKCKEQLIKKAEQAGVPVKEFFFGNIDLPPAVLTPEKVEELSKKMKKAYEQQQQTYKQLVKTNETKATADQQTELVKAKILKEKSIYEKEAKKIKGEGERAYTEEIAKGQRFALEEVAKGQEKQKEVLGADKTYQLEMWKLTMEFLNKHPEAANAVPSVYINKTGSTKDGSFDEGAAIMAIQQLKKAQESLTKDKK